MYTFLNAYLPQNIRTWAYSSIYDNQFYFIGFIESRLPSFTNDESIIIKSSYDFLGVNFYTTSIVYSDIHNISDISFYADSDVSTYQVLCICEMARFIYIDIKWPSLWKMVKSFNLWYEYNLQENSWYGSGSNWLKITPWGIRKSLQWIDKEYNHPKIYVTENGFSDNIGNVDDLQRIYYHKHYINQVRFPYCYKKETHKCSIV